jgi:pSer/pThr/pTyr-binding forkhead associated (FHA) protein
MGSLRNLSSGKTLALEPEQVIGRAPTCAICLPYRYVSARHAVIRWNGGKWELRDLGSRNGTFQDGSRLKPEEVYPMSVGSNIAFGKLLADPWELLDESAPSVIAVPIDGSGSVRRSGDSLRRFTPETIDYRLMNSTGRRLL